MLDLNQVALFVAVVRQGSFAAAARRLGMPANTVSRQVQQLEQSLGQRLLHRSTRKLALTAAGQGFFERCQGAVSEIAEAGQALAGEGDAPSGQIRVAAPADFIHGASIRWIAPFLAEHPRVNLEFVLSDGQADLVGEGIDLAFRAAALESASQRSRLLVVNQFILVASPAYVAARGLPAEPQALAAHDGLMQRADHRRALPTVWRLQGPGGAIVEVPVRGRFIANTAGAVLQAALAGLGVALLPGVLAAPQLRAGRLVRVLPEYRREGGGMQLVMPHRRQVPRAVTAFADFVMRRVQWDWQEAPAE